MKKVFAIFNVFLFASLAVQAQTPEKMSYQAVIRNSSNALVPNTQIGMEINIRQDSSTGVIVYTETHTPTTNATGLVSIEIGGGAGFNTINWGSDDFYIEIKTAIVAPLTTYTNISTSQLLSVPYALHAKTADTIIGGIAETDPIYSSSQAANITTTDITKLSNLSGTNTGDQDLSNLASKSALADSIALVRSQIPDVSGYATTSVVATGLASKVDKETNKGLSTNDYTNTEKTKLEGIATGAEVNVNADWNATTGDAQVLNKPDLGVYATTTTVNTGLSNKVDKETGKGLSTNDYSNNDKSKLSSIAYGAEVNVNADWNALSGDAQILNKPVGNNIGDIQYWNGAVWVVVPVGIPGQMLQLSASKVPVWSGNVTLDVGSFYQGGKVAYILQAGDPGYIAGQTHGLIVLTNDISTSIVWHATTAGNVASTGTAIGTGAANTNAIIALYGTENNAARICYDLVIGGYSDWYLPSKDELNKIYLNKGSLGYFPNAVYWSSSEGNNGDAWSQIIDSGSQFYYSKPYSGSVRPVRAF